MTTIVGVTILDDYVLLGDAGQAMAMVHAGAERLVDLRGEVRPPKLFPVPIDHFPLIDLEPGQDELIEAVATHLANLAAAGTRVGIYCQAGISRTSTVAIAYLLQGGATLEDATVQVRTARPQSMPAVELRKSLERIYARSTAARSTAARSTAAAANAAAAAKATATATALPLTQIPLTEGTAQ